MSSLFNPLDKRNLGESITRALLSQAPSPLGGVTRFDGAGIYAIYYKGTFAPYAALAEAYRRPESQTPIYIGKAVPKGARKGTIDLDAGHGTVLWARLRDHADSIAQAANLDLGDFDCRYLAVDDIWIPLGESLLISRFAPVWNALVDGFGNHDPGTGRHLGMRPRWDALHPGRAWAMRCKDRLETADQIANDVMEYLRANVMVGGDGA